MTKKRENFEQQNCEFLWYDKPAANWNEALPLGNGSLGAMVFGGIAEERLSFNLDTLWSGRPEQTVNPALKNALEPARKLIRAGKYHEATEFLDKNTGNYDSASYIPAGDVIINTDIQGQIQTYSRSLDLQSACAVTDMQTDNDLHISRECFVSFPDKVFVMEIKSRGQVKLNFSCHLSCETAGKISVPDTNSLLFEGAMPIFNRYGKTIWQDDEGRTGICYAMQLSVFPSGGTLRTENEKICISNADSALVLVTIVSNFKNYKTAPEDSDINCAAVAVKYISNAVKIGSSKLRERHIEDYSKLYCRSILHLPETENKAFTIPERLFSSWKQKETFSPALAALAYNCGRYLLICCSRPGTQAANLQGIWNDQIGAPWGCNYTVNINTEMNYWHAETANLAECAEPLFDLIFDLAEKGKIAAKEIYGLDGWCLHHNTDIWRFCANASGKSRWSLWPMGGAWFCRHLAEHIRYSNDKSFLEKAFPVILEQAKFLTGLLQKHNDRLTTIPSTSPENNFLDPETKQISAVAYGAQMDISLIREVLENVMEFSAEFPDTDKDFIQKIPDILAQLQLPKIGKYGELLEYGEEFEEENIHHRHLSHLYGAYPGTEFTPDKNPEFYQACIKSLERRGDISTGWAMGWRAALWARFRDPQKLLTVLKHFFHPVGTEFDDWQGGGIYLNFLDAHPPFQIDGNFGITAALAEVFLQAHRTNQTGLPVIELFPCLPSNWICGSINGLRTPCGLEIDLSWQNNKAAVAILAKRDVRFECRGELFHLKSNEKKIIEFTI